MLYIQRYQKQRSLNLSREFGGTTYFTFIQACFPAISFLRTCSRVFRGSLVSMCLGDVGQLVFHPEGMLQCIHDALTGGDKEGN